MRLVRALSSTLLLVASGSLMFVAGCGVDAQGAPQEAPATFETSALESRSRLPSAYTFEFFNVPGATQTRANAINDRGVVAGAYFDSGHVKHGFIRGTDGRVAVFDPSASSGTAATGINDQGTIVGGFLDEVGVDHGFIRAGDGEITQVDFPGASSTFLTSINNRGIMVGGYNDIGTGFVLEHGSFSTVADAPGALPMNTGPSDINDPGTSVGCFLDSGGNTVGYILSGGQYTDVRGPVQGFTCLWRVNDSGIAVGTDLGTFDGSFVLDIRRPLELIPFECPGGLGTTIRGINNHGQITGFCITEPGGPRRGFVASPLED